MKHVLSMTITVMAMGVACKERSSQQLSSVSSLSSAKDSFQLTMDMLNEQELFSADIARDLAVVLTSLDDAASNKKNATGFALDGSSKNATTSAGDPAQNLSETLAKLDVAIADKNSAEQQQTKQQRIAAIHAEMQKNSNQMRADLAKSKLDFTNNYQLLSEKYAAIATASKQAVQQLKIDSASGDDLKKARTQIADFQMQLNAITQQQKILRDDFTKTTNTLQAKIEASKRPAWEIECTVALSRGKGKEKWRDETLRSLSDAKYRFYSDNVLPAWKSGSGLELSGMSKQAALLKFGRARPLGTLAIDMVCESANRNSHELSCHASTIAFQQPKPTSDNMFVSFSAKDKYYEPDTDHGYADYAVGQRPDSFTMSYSDPLIIKDWTESFVRFWTKFLDPLFEATEHTDWFLKKHWEIAFKFIPVQTCQETQRSVDLNQPSPEAE